ncbi:sister chromatid cohesion 1 protein 3-like [Curcuma longa]|uniref:sister chromatid cohesion 1 protein 3-like n=1 Tax=Curcuma longa TaxID=136217 RepID=UPI003D9FA25E
MRYPEEDHSLLSIKILDELDCDVDTTWIDMDIDSEGSKTTNENPYLPFPVTAENEAIRGAQLQPQTKPDVESQLQPQTRSGYLSELLWTRRRGLSSIVRSWNNRYTAAENDDREWRRAVGNLVEVVHSEIVAENLDKNPSNGSWLRIAQWIARDAKNRGEVAGETLIVAPPSAAGIYPIGRLQTPQGSRNSMEEVWVDRDSPICQALPHLELELQPSPPVREQKRKRRMKKHSYDEKIVLTNADMKKQLEDTTKLVCKRRKLPCSVLDLYKYHSNRLNDQVFHEPLLSGMCSNLHEVFSRSFPLHSNNSSHMEVLSELANELSHVTSKDLQKEPEQQNNLDGEIKRHSDRNMEPEQQDKLNAIPENSLFDMHIDIEPEQQDELNLIPENPRFDMHTGAIINETIQSPSGGVDMTPFSTTIAGSTHDFDKTFDTEILPTVESFTRTEATSYATGASLFSLEEEPLQNSMPRIPSVLLSVEEDFDFLDASTQSSGYKENEAGTLSARTRAVAQFLKNQSPPQSRDKEHGVLSLNDILEGKARRRCAQMFFESLVLKTCGFVDIQQEEAYGDIVISPTPALFATEF